ncbi:dual OB domain-containing protein [Gloeobacter morelensis]|uniref:Dual OB-containing domain-containing protein n=1 Tax=Gloeobacter morelensis MG652769 TaxID=2781736 RepID=A0ABY3PIY7_9CYAN|nr:hypothetical protein [Gloeobacter morelensis]UFP93615.1 hypothetical protein ISF26_17760 [Gloeobacter morelensis MG652769]
MPIVDILCLANSRKYQEYCIAGLDYKGGGWFRPVGNGEKGALRYDECRCADGSQPQVLDRLRIELSEHSPEPWQPENWLVGQQGWERVESPAKNVTLQRLRKRISHGPSLLGSVGSRITLIPQVRM